VPAAVVFVAVVLVALVALYWVGANQQLQLGGCSTDPGMCSLLPKS
jgi:hypothetical protein